MCFPHKVAEEKLEGLAKVAPLEGKKKKKIKGKK